MKIILLIDLYYLSLQTMCDLLLAQRFHSTGLQVGHVLCSAHQYWYLAFFGAYDMCIGNQVFLFDIQPSVATLIDCVVVHRGTHLLQPEFLYLRFTHVNEVEQLQLVGIQLHTKRYSDHYIRVLREAAYGIGP